MECAAKRGVPTTIHRLGRVSGDSYSGVASVEDFMCRMIKGCVQLGAAPVLDWPIDLNPADLVARLVVHTSLQPGAHGMYHICHPRPRTWVWLCQWLQRFGYRLSTLEYEEWRRQLVAALAASPAAGADTDTTSKEENALTPLIHAFSPNAADMGSIATMPAFDARRCHISAQRPSGDYVAPWHGGLAHPDIDDALLKLYVAHGVCCCCCSCGFGCGCGCVCCCCCARICVCGLAVALGAALSVRWAHGMCAAVLLTHRYFEYFERDGFMPPRKQLRPRHHRNSSAASDSRRPSTASSTSSAPRAVPGTPPVAADGPRRDRPSRSSGELQQLPAQQDDDDDDNVFHMDL